MIFSLLLVFTILTIWYFGSVSDNRKEGYSGGWSFSAGLIFAILVLIILFIWIIPDIVAIQQQ